MFRTVLEETGYHVWPVRLVGLYSKLEKDDLLNSIEVKITGNEGWRPGGEIAEQGFFDPKQLPEPMRCSTRTRIMDGLE